MKTSILLCAILSLPAFAFSQTFKIDKVKGRKAIVTISGGSVRAGESYNVGGGSYGGSSGSSGSRNNIIGLSAGFSNLTQSSSGQSSSSTDMSFGGRYGWNAKVYEYGGIFSYRNSSGNDTSSSSYTLGGFFDYNLTANNPGTESLFGIGGYASIGSQSTKINNNSESYSITEFFGGGFGKYWLLGTTTAIRGDIGYLYQSRSTNPASTLSGITATVGLSHYF